MPEDSKPKRRLAAIVFTDIVGFTKLSAKDETKAAELIKRQRALLVPIIQSHDGELLKEMGDGLLLSFYSATSAVECAIEKQKIAKSINNNVRSSVRKLNPILKDIVGKKVEVVIRNLEFSEKRITKDIRKTINSAVANAENNFQYDIDKLFIKEAYCGKQVVMKRFRARAKGRAAPILKPYSNLTIILSEKQNKEVKHGTKS